MNATLFKALNILIYILAISAFSMFMMKVFFHRFSNDDIITIVFAAIVLKLIVLRFPPNRKGGGDVGVPRCS